MRALPEWTEEHWDVIAMVASLAAALVVALLVGVAYNVTTARLDPPLVTPSAGPAAPDVVDDPEPHWSDGDGPERGAAVMGQAPSAGRSPSEST